MSVGIGSKSKLGYIVETAYGTFPASPTGIQLGILSESIQNTRNTFQSEELNPLRKVTAVRSGNVAAGGDINVELSPNALGTFLRHLLMNTVTTTTVTPTAITNSLATTRGAYYSANSRTYLCTRSGTTSANAAANFTSQDSAEEFLEGTAYFQYYAPVATTLYKHVLNAGATKPTGGFSMEREVFLDGGSQFFRYVGGRVNGFNLTIPQEGIITGVLSMIFLDLDTTASTTIWNVFQTPSDEPFAGSQAVIQTKAPAGSYADDFTISQASMSVQNNFEANVYSVGLKRRRDLPEGRRVVTGSFTAHFENMTNFNYFKNESTIGLKMTFNNAGMFMSIELPYVKLSGGSPAPVISGQGVVSASFDYQAFADGANYDVIVEMYNSTSAYTA